MQNYIKINYPSYISDIFSIKSWQQKLILTSIATIILAISANVSIPTQPVPFTFQSLAVLLVGAMLGRKLATIAVLQYLAIGLMGFPVFANGSGGFAMVMISPSAGYLIGFIFSAYLAGLTSEIGMDRKIITGIVGFAIAHQIVFVFGVVYLKFFLNVSFIEAIKLGYLPFAGFDFIKFAFATFTMFTLWNYRNKISKNA